MKKTILAIFLVLFLLTGCVTFGKFPAEEAGITTALERKDYKILGEVKVKGTVSNILGFITFGGKGYEDLLAQARSQYEDCDAVINIYQDKSSLMVLGVYNSQSVTLIGTAIDIIEDDEV